MTKQELIKEYQEIVLKTNGGVDDYVVALCQIANAINELDDQYQQIAELKKHLEEAKQTGSYQVMLMVQKENVLLKQQLSDEEKAHDLCIDSFNEECEKLRKQIKFESDARERFKQSQNQKAIEVLEKVRQLFMNGIDNLFTRNYVCNIVEIQIKKLKGENNE